jgi:hypothetical protein
MRKNVKKLNIWLFAIIAGVSMTAMTSCSDDDDNTDDTGTGKTDPSTIAADNLIAYFPFEDAVNPEIGTGITYASKGASTSFPTGQRGKAFQGKDDGTSFLVYSLASGNKLVAAKEYTLAFWLKEPKEKNARGIFFVNGGDGNMGSLGLFTDNSNIFTGDSINIKSYLYNTSTEWKGQDYVSHAYLQNTWTHVVALYRKETSTIELYANGVQVASNARFASDVDADGNQPPLGALTLDNASTKIYFGKWHDEGLAQDWKKPSGAAIDEFRIYDKALTAEEVENLYKAEVLNINE